MRLCGCLAALPTVCFALMALQDKYGKVLTAHVGDDKDEADEVSTEVFICRTAAPTVSTVITSKTTQLSTETLLCTRLLLPR